MASHLVRPPSCDKERYSGPFTSSRRFGIRWANLIGGLANGSRRGAESWTSWAIQARSSARRAGARALPPFGAQGTFSEPSCLAAAFARRANQATAQARPVSRNSRFPEVTCPAADAQVRHGQT